MLKTISLLQSLPWVVINKHCLFKLRIQNTKLVKTVHIARVLQFIWHYIDVVVKASLLRPTWYKT